MHQLSQTAARRYLLDWQGLWGKKRFSGARGVLAYVQQAGCIQFDPLDICGRNADLVLQARVSGYTPRLLEEALYKHRVLMDGWDKNMAIYPTADWPHYARNRAYFRENPYDRENRALVAAVGDDLRARFAARGPLKPGDVDYGQKVEWAWAATSLSRAAMEALFFEGDLIVHHRSGTQRTFDLAERCVPQALFTAPDPFENQGEYDAWRIARRIAAVGLLWDKASDALLGVTAKGAARAAAFARLQEEGRILPVTVEGVPGTLYAPQEALAYLEHAQTSRASAQKPPRTECIAPLDNLLWDRKLVEAVFGFYYRWEVYTPAKQRQYGYYVMPVLQGDALVGRIELVRQRAQGTLLVKGAWWERPVDMDGVKEALDRFTAMLGLAGWEGLEA